jgi:hypothetical protein
MTSEVTTTNLMRQLKLCKAGCEELEQTSTAEAYLRFCSAGKKCIDRDRNFVEK